MLLRPVIIFLIFAIFPAFCSISESPLRGCGVEMEKRIEQKAAKGGRSHRISVPHRIRFRRLMCYEKQKSPQKRNGHELPRDIAPVSG